jgi:hypothetical protein
VEGLSTRKRSKEGKAIQQIPFFSNLRCKKPPLKLLKGNHEIKHSVKKGGGCYHVITCYGLYLQERRHLIVRENILSDTPMTATTNRKLEKCLKGSRKT